MSNEPTNNTTPTPAKHAAQPIPYWRSAVFGLLCVAVGLACMTDKSVIQSNEAGVKMDLPLLVGGYSGQKMEVTQAEKTILPMDTEFERCIYTTFSGMEINCQIVLSGGERRSIHRPEICLPGQGWDIKSGEAVELDLGEGRSIDAMQLILSRPVKIAEDDTRQMESIFMYWFIGSDKTTAHHYERILLSSMDRVLHGLNHRWAYIVVSANVPASIVPGRADREEVAAELERFVAEIAPYIMKEKVRKNL